MSSSESENNERYDLEDNLNFYGSTVANSGNSKASTTVLTYAINYAEPSTAEHLARPKLSSDKDTLGINIF